MNMYIHLFNDSFISRSDYINKVSTDKTPVTRRGNPGLKGTKKQKQGNNNLNLKGDEFVRKPLS